MVGTLALIVAMSGTAYVAHALPKSSVGAKQLKTMPSPARTSRTAVSPAPTPRRARSAPSSFSVSDLGIHIVTQS